jgi:hypothetical protein
MQGKQTTRSDFNAGCNALSLLLESHLLRAYRFPAINFTPCAAFYCPATWLRVCLFAARLEATKMFNVYKM